MHVSATHGADCPYRKILVNDKKTNRQRVEVEHAAGWRFLMFHGQFKTRLIVEQVLRAVYTTPLRDQSSLSGAEFYSVSQDGIARIMTFTLKPGSGGLMRQFEGTWYVKPDLDSAGKGPSCVATLRQKIMPLIHGPGLDWIVTGAGHVSVCWLGLECISSLREPLPWGTVVKLSLISYSQGVILICQLPPYRHLQTSARQPRRGSEAGSEAHQ